MRRYWPVLLVLTATLALGATWLIVNHLTREEPNYSRIDEGLYLGGLVPKPPPGTHAVLNLCETADPYRLEVNNWVPIPDAEPGPSLAWLREQVEFIEAQRRAGRQVFIHCRNGVSRSGMVVVAYEMWKNRWTREEALAFVRARRPGVRPNPAFMSLLAEWEQVLKSRTD
jgi:protein-tyrosine phosphatase